MTSLKGLGPALVRLRKERELKAREVADRAGITKAMLSAYENERTRPGLESLEKVLDGMDADVADLAKALGQSSPWRGGGRHLGLSLSDLLEHRELRSAVADTLEGLGRLAAALADYLREAPREEPASRKEPAGG